MIAKKKKKRKRKKEEITIAVKPSKEKCTKYFTSTNPTRSDFCCSSIASKESLHINDFPTHEKHLLIITISNDKLISHDPSNNGGRKTYRKCHFLFIEYYQGQINRCYIKTSKYFR